MAIDPRTLLAFRAAKHSASAAASPTNSSPAIPLVGRLTAEELRRRTWHILPGFLPIILWFVPHADPVSPTLRLIMVGLIVVIGLSIWTRFHRIRRDGETDHDQTQSVVGYVLAVLGMLLGFPHHAELGFCVLAILAFGDGSATLGGLMFRSRRLPWNPEKSWAGLLCFVLVGGTMSSLIYWRETHNLEAISPGVDFPTALLIGGFASLLAGLIESLPMRLNDNIRVGLSASAAVITLQTVFVGWAA